MNYSNFNPLTDEWKEFEAKAQLIKDMPVGTRFFDICGEEWERIEHPEETVNLAFVKKAANSNESCFAACAKGIVK